MSFHKEWVSLKEKLLKHIKEENIKNNIKLLDRLIDNDKRHLKDKEDKISRLVGIADRMKLVMENLSHYLLPMTIQKELFEFVEVIFEQLTEAEVKEAHDKIMGLVSHSRYSMTSEDYDAHIEYSRVASRIQECHRKQLYEIFKKFNYAYLTAAADTKYYDDIKGHIEQIVKFIVRYAYVNQECESDLNDFCKDLEDLLDKHLKEENTPFIEAMLAGLKTTRLIACRQGCSKLTRSLVTMLLKHHQFGLFRYFFKDEYSFGSRDILLFIDEAIAADHLEAFNFLLDLLEKKEDAISDMKLLYAVGCGASQIVERLISCGLDINKKIGKTEGTFLDMAVHQFLNYSVPRTRERYLFFIATLLKNGADPNQVAYGKTALQKAVEVKFDRGYGSNYMDMNGMRKLFDLLIEYNAKFKDFNNDFIFLCCQELDVAEFFAKKGVKVDKFPAHMHDRLSAFLKEENSEKTKLLCRQYAYPVLRNQQPDKKNLLSCLVPELTERVIFNLLAMSKLTVEKSEVRKEMQSIAEQAMKASVKAHFLRQLYHVVEGRHFEDGNSFFSTLPIEALERIMSEVAKLSGIEIDEKEMWKWTESISNTMGLIKTLRNDDLKSKHIDELIKQLQKYVLQGDVSTSLVAIQNEFARAKSQDVYEARLAALKKALIKRLQNILLQKDTQHANAASLEKLKTQFACANIGNDFNNMIQDQINRPNGLLYIKQLPVILTYLDVNAKNNEGKTLLYYAIVEGDKSALVILMGKQPKLKDIYRGQSAQFWAVYHGRTDLLPVLTQCEKEKDTNYYIDRSMLSAAKHKHTDLVSGLIRRGADVLFKSKRKSETALIKALRNRDFPTATVLLQAGDFSPFVAVLQKACEQYFAAGKGGEEGCYRAGKLKTDMMMSKSLFAVFSLLHKHLVRLEKPFIFSPTHGGNLKENSFDTFLLKTLYDDTNLKDWFYYEGEQCPIAKQALDNESGRAAFRASLIARLDVKINQTKELAASITLKC